MQKKAERFYTIVDTTIDLLDADDSVKTSRQGLKANAYRNGGYTRSLYLDNFAITMDYNRNFWKNTTTAETPFWVAVRSDSWEETAHMEEVLRSISDWRKEAVYYATFLALVPLTDATLDEVCRDLKQQILDYVKLFR